MPSNIPQRMPHFNLPKTSRKATAIVLLGIRQIRSRKDKINYERRYLHYENRQLSKQILFSIPLTLEPRVSIFRENSLFISRTEICLGNVFKEKNPTSLCFLVVSYEGTN